MKFDVKCRRVGGIDAPPTACLHFTSDFQLVVRQFGAAATLWHANVHDVITMKAKGAAVGLWRIKRRISLHSSWLAVLQILVATVLLDLDIWRGNGSDVCGGHDVHVRATSRHDFRTRHRFSEFVDRSADHHDCTTLPYCCCLHRQPRDADLLTDVQAGGEEDHQHFCLQSDSSRPRLHVHGDHQVASTDFGILCTDEDGRSKNFHVMLKIKLRWPT